MDNRLVILIKVLEEDKHIDLVLWHVTSAQTGGLDVQLFIATKKPEKCLTEQIWELNGEKLLSCHKIKVQNGRRISLLYQSQLLITAIVCPRLTIKQNGFYAHFQKLPSGVLQWNGSKESKYTTYMDDFSLEGSSIIIDRVGISDYRSSSAFNTDLEFYKSEAYSDLFYANYNQFWQYCYKMMVKLIRNDFYYAIFILDHNIKKRLIEMIGWLNEFAAFPDEAIGAQVDIAAMIASGIYPHSSINEMKASIQKTIWAYKGISHQVALKAGLSVNPNFEQVVETFINDNLIIQP